MKKIFEFGTRSVVTGVEYYFTFFRDGRFTLCYSYTLEPGAKVSEGFNLGYAFCSKSDKFDYATGIMVAYKRAVKNLIRAIDDKEMSYFVQTLCIAFSDSGI